MKKTLVKIAIIAALLGGTSAPASAGFTVPGMAHALLNGTVDYLCAPNPVHSWFPVLLWHPCFD